MSEIVSESINLVLWTWRDTTLIQRVWHMLQNLYGVVDLHSTRWNAENPYMGSWKKPQLVICMAKLASWWVSCAKIPSLVRWMPVSLGDMNIPRRVNTQKLSNWWWCLALQDGKEESCWHGPNDCLREHSTHTEGWKIPFTTWSDVTS